MLANKLAPALPVGLVAVSASRTSPACVSRVNQGDRYARETSFVLQKQSDLRERPGRMPGALFTPNRCPGADVRQVFERDSSSGVFGACDELLADYMIGVAAETGFTSGESAQDFLGPFGAQVLEPLPVAMMSPSYFLDRFTAADIPVTVGGDVDDSKVNTKKVVDFNRRFVWQVNRGVEVETAPATDKIALPLDPVEAFPLVLAENQGNKLPSFERKQAHTIHTFEAHQPLIVGHRAVRLERRTFLAVAPKALDRFANGTNRHLRRETKTLTEFPIAEFMDGGGAESFSLESGTGGVSSGGVELLHRDGEQTALRRIREQLELQCEFHAPILGQKQSVVKCGPLPL